LEGRGVAVEDAVLLGSLVGICLVGLALLNFRYLLLFLQKRRGLPTEMRLQTCVSVPQGLLSLLGRYLQATYFFIIILHLQLVILYMLINIFTPRLIFIFILVFIEKILDPLENVILFWDAVLSELLGVNFRRL
jgi:hypothetical protein